MAMDANNDFTIRSVLKTDEAAVRLLVEDAFGKPAEANLVDALRACGALDLEQVAVDDRGQVIGHVAFSTVTGVGPGHRLKITCLAPVCVSRHLRGEGVGSAMISHSLALLGEGAFDLALVLGPPAYYTRFGFDPVLARKISGPYAGDAFMALAFTSEPEKTMPIEVTFATPFSTFE